MYYARDTRGDGDLWDYCVDDPVNSVDPWGRLEGEAVKRTGKIAKGLGIAAMSDIAEALPGDVGIIAKWAAKGYGYGSAVGPVAGTTGAIGGAAYGFSQTETNKEWGKYMENGGSDIYEEYAE